MEPFGEILGYAPGNVAIYCSNEHGEEYALCKKDNANRHYLDHEFMGYKWQSVEFARRYLYQNFGTVFTDVMMAYEIFSLRFLRHTDTERRLPLHAFANGSSRKPLKGALLIWADKGIFEKTGHVAVIT